MKELTAFRKALSAFDELYAATCGQASHEQLAAHFGARSAERIMSAKVRRDALKWPTKPAALSPETDQ